MRGKRIGGDVFGAGAIAHRLDELGFKTRCSDDLDQPLNIGTHRIARPRGLRVVEQFHPVISRRRSSGFAPSADTGGDGSTDVPWGKGEDGGTGDRRQRGGKYRLWP